MLVAGEDPHRVHPTGEEGVTDGNLDRRGGPLGGDVFLDPVRSTRLAEPHEAAQQLGQALDKEAHRAAGGEVVGHSLAQRAHDAPAGQRRTSCSRAASCEPVVRAVVPGHGRASGRSAISSTLA